MRGFSFIEVLVVVAILGALSTIAFLQLAGRVEDAQRGAADGIVFYLEGVKADAVAGRLGTAHGIKFDSSSYTVFSGASYDPDDDANRTYEIDARLSLSYDGDDPDQAVVFSRITGAVADPAIITVEKASGEAGVRIIEIGPRGDISLSNE